MEPSPHFPCLSRQIASPSAARYCPSDPYSPSEQQPDHLSFASGEPSGVDWASLLLPRPTQEGEGEAGREKGRSSGRTRKVVNRPRFAFRTRSRNDVLDDGYRWRKYGQKAVKNSMYPRSYYRCTHHTCNVKKQVQRMSEDTSIVVTTYEGVHNHPCEKLMEALSPLLKQVQLLAPVMGML
ncbi:hypothetical protein OPV22_033732 [Ensete ventricosum]|uniref:WRKY domain-containing protein n=1 Tax=Ensete ventricosum TaxID=4639 RepID=A0AAV8P3L4_ENSVE|nr:hypothetical protein OPV22_033732 [Ensete ventricosum]RWW33486.1 hypothetical protein GW17_00001793 [Ensete ventricosum]